MIIVPVGIDCGLVDALRKLNLRDTVLPYEWNVTYSGVADIIKNDFSDDLEFKKTEQNLAFLTNMMFFLFTKTGKIYTLEDLK